MAREQIEHYAEIKPTSSNIRIGRLCICISNINTDILGNV